MTDDDKSDKGGSGVVSIVSNNGRSKMENKAFKKKLKAIHFGFESIFMGKSIGFQCFGKFSDIDNDKFFIDQ